MSSEYSNEQVLTFSSYFLIVEGERSGANYGRYDGVWRRSWSVGAVHQGREES